MPTYDYQCDACGHRFEHFQSITTKALRKCPECGRLKIRRLIGAGGGIIFKGSGFYQTDYRSEAYKTAAGKEKPAASTSSESGGDKKPAASTNSESGGDKKPAATAGSSKGDGEGKKKD